MIGSLVKIVWILVCVNSVRDGNPLEEGSLGEEESRYWIWHLYFGGLKTDCEVANSQVIEIELRLDIGGLILNLSNFHRFREIFPRSRGPRSDEVSTEGHTVAVFSPFSGLEDSNLLASL